VQTVFFSLSQVELNSLFLKIAQRFSAGFSSPPLSKSRPGRQRSGVSAERRHLKICGGLPTRRYVIGHRAQKGHGWQILLRTIKRR
jgi:hypothetical protein